MTRRIRNRDAGGDGAVRPTTSRVLSALFSMFGPEGVEGLSVLDLYAGKGGFGIEALRRGAGPVVMVERSRRSCNELQRTVDRLIPGDESVRIVCGDVQRSLSGLSGPFDVVFADPPYASRPFGDLAKGLAEHGLVRETGRLILEHFHKSPPPQELSGFVLASQRRYGDTGISIYRPAGTVREVPGEPVE